MGKSVCKHTDLFCICERNKFSEQVNDFVVKGDIMATFSWACNREGSDAKKVLSDVMKSVKIQ